jgi:ankyrin repeat protein
MTDCVDEDGCVELHRAALEGDVDEVERLLAAGSFVDAKTIMFWQGLNPECTSLHVAALRGHFDVVRLLLERGGASIDARNVHGETALHLAAYACKESVVEYLCFKGADAESRTFSGYE